MTALRRAALRAIERDIGAQALALSDLGGHEEAVRALRMAARLVGDAIEGRASSTTRAAAQPSLEGRLARSLAVLKVAGDDAA